MCWNSAKKTCINKTKLQIKLLIDSISASNNGEVYLDLHYLLNKLKALNLPKLKAYDSNIMFSSAKDYQLYQRDKFWKEKALQNKGLFDKKGLRMNATISEQHHIYGHQVIEYILRNFITLHPIHGRIRIVLQLHQKMLIKQILLKNNIIRQSRQCGMSSLFVWIAQAITAINPKIKTVIYVQSNGQKLCMKRRIAQLNGIKIDVRCLTLYVPSGITHLLLYDLSGPYTDQINTLLIHTNLKLDDSKLISITLNYPGVEQYKLWRDSLLKKSKFNAMYLPWYIIGEKSQDWGLRLKTMLGCESFYNDYLV